MAYALCGAPARAADVARPPQFVAIAFDNCTELDRWREWRDFASELDNAGKPVRFTFFVSGINFLANAGRSIYLPPREPRGSSRINFGGTADEVRARVALINELHAQGHEIGSHAVGHFDGRSWSQAEWLREFHMFDELFRNAAPNNGLPAADGFDFPASRIVGFRAPYLAHGDGLYSHLRTSRFRYDTSGVSEPSLWPKKKDGVWRFNLASIRLAGADRRTLSMDYNFLVAHSFGLNDRRNAARYREQMLQSYLGYFRANYSGNRAPLHIGHHFSDYQGGAYREALKTFARMVCGLPEVRCVTYSELADYMDGLSGETVAAYQAGDFPRASLPVMAEDASGEAVAAARTSRGPN